MSEASLATSVPAIPWKGARLESVVILKAIARSQQGNNGNMKSQGRFNCLYLCPSVRPSHLRSRRDSFCWTLMGFSWVLPWQIRRRLFSMRVRHSFHLPWRRRPRAWTTRANWWFLKCKDHQESPHCLFCPRTNAWSNSSAKGILQSAWKAEDVPLTRVYLSWGEDRAKTLNRGHTSSNLAEGKKERGIKTWEDEPNLKNTLPILHYNPPIAHPPFKKFHRKEIEIFILRSKPILIVFFHVSNRKRSNFKAKMK